MERNAWSKILGMGFEVWALGCLGFEFWDLGIWDIDSEVGVIWDIGFGMWVFRI